MALKSSHILSLFLVLSLGSVPTVCVAKKGQPQAPPFAFIDQEIKQHIDEGKLVGAVTWIS